MSFIRSTSNPEAMYSWGEDDNVTRIVFGPKPLLSIPTDIFENSLKSWYDYYEDDKYEVDKDDNVYVESKDVRITEKIIKGKLKWEFEYKGNSKYKPFKFDLCEVTMYYLVHSNKYRWEQKNK